MTTKRLKESQGQTTSTKAQKKAKEREKSALALARSIPAARLGPEGEVPEGLSNEGAANLAASLPQNETQGVRDLASQEPPMENERAESTSEQQDRRDETEPELSPRRGPVPLPEEQKGPEDKGEKETGEQKKAPGDGRPTRKKREELKDKAKGKGTKSTESTEETRDISGEPDIEFIAREYAIHEKWASLPADRDDVTKEYNVNGPAAQQGTPTLSVEQRRELLNRALGFGMASGGVQFGIGLAVRLGVNQAFKFMATKGAGKAIPFVGLAFSAWDLGTLITQKQWFGKQGAFYKAFASGVPLSQRLKAIKQIIDLLSSILGIAAGICGVIAALTLWSVAGGITFSALAAGLGIASAALSLVSTGLMAAAAYFEYQEILHMEGSPEQVLQAIATFEGDVHNATEGLLMAPGRVKGITEDWRKIQRRLFVERVPPPQEDTNKKPLIVTSQNEGPATPKSKIVLAGTNDLPTTTQAAKSGPAITTNSQSASGGQNIQISKEPQISNKKILLAGEPELPKTPPQILDAHGNPIRSARYITASDKDPTLGGHGSKGLGKELLNSLRGKGVYGPEVEYKPESFSGLGRAYVKGKSPDPGRTVQAFAPNAMLGPILVSDKVPVSAIADSELQTVRPDTTYVPATGSQNARLIRHATLAPLPEPPFDLHATTKRLEKAAGYAREEENLKKAVEVGEKGAGELSRELSNEGAAGRLKEAHARQVAIITSQEAEVEKKAAKVTSSEQLLETQRQKDAETKNKAQEGIANESAQRIADITSDPFLSTVVRGGATVAKAVGGVVNLVGKAFGAKEPVVNTQAIDKVRELFREAPRAREARGKAKGLSNEIGSAAEQTAPKVRALRSNIEQTKTKKESAKGKVKGYEAAGKRLKDQLANEKTSLTQETATYRSKLEEARASKEKELSAYQSEMSALHVWAIEHRSVRDANNVLLEDMKNPPQRPELTAESQAMVESAKADVARARQGLDNAHQRMQDIALDAKQQLLNKTAGLVGDAEQFYAKLRTQAEAFSLRFLEPHRKTLASIEASLGTVAPERLPDQVGAAKRVARAAELATADALNAFERFTARAIEEALGAVAYEVRRRNAASMSLQ